MINYDAERPTNNSTAAHVLRTLPSHSVEHRATVRAIRATARRALMLEAEAAEHETELELLVTAACPSCSTDPASASSLLRSS
ncbi:hypothetical protein BZL29_2952 [Mycobacterium kansasii]|uniref:Uncharacterized protein n=2 Tax=Mycobacterium kansasii TaxID=1768 RepID=A0A1V3XDU6_MYCKA|nr:hypothetical protein BZL29_2952 [Mycobacterium kansasii]